MSLNILIVDDSAVTRQMIAKTLGMSQVPVGELFQAGDGAEALEIIEDNWIDLMFADINMPIMDGEELVQHVRANPALEDLAIIVVSTEGSQTRIDNLIALGARFVHKPFTPEQLRDVVTEMLGITNESV